MRKIKCLCVLLFLFYINQLFAVNETNLMINRRFAFVVGANDGGCSRIKLQYAISDAESITKVFKEMGGVLPDDVKFLAEPDRNAFFKGMKSLADLVKRSRSEFRRVEVFFYYSGHSDEENILLGEEKISYKEFRNLINAINADVRIAILDSCASGAFTQMKGVKKRPPFLMDSAYDMKGFAFMSSSSSHEVSQESGRLRGSFFTHYLVSGMRGAADMTLDGRVTLSEAYHYAYKETLSQTEKTLSGPQHPSYNIQMSGKGDVVMTDIRKSSAVLRVGKDISGRIFIHSQENVLVVEVNKPAGRVIEIGLEEGKYRIININEDGIFESDVTLKHGEHHELVSDQLRKTDKVYTTPRGDILSATKKYDYPKEMEISLLMGYTPDNNDFDSATDVGVSGSFRLSRSLMLEGDFFYYIKPIGSSYRYLDFENYFGTDYYYPDISYETRIKSSVLNFNVSIVYEFKYQSEKFIPYLSSGLGLLNLKIDATVKEMSENNSKDTITISQKSSNTDLNLSIGFGIKYLLGKKWGVRLDGRYIRLLTRSSQGHLRISGGIFLKLSKSTD